MTKSLGRWRVADASRADGQAFRATPAAPLLEDPEIEDEPAPASDPDPAEAP
jgi:hypothetical protein